MRAVGKVLDRSFSQVAGLGKVSPPSPRSHGGIISPYNKLPKIWVKSQKWPRIPEKENPLECILPAESDTNSASVRGL